MSIHVNKIQHPLYDALIDYVKSKSRAFQAWKSFYGNQKTMTKAIYFSLFPSLFNLLSERKKPHVFTSTRTYKNILLQFKVDYNISPSFMVDHTYSQQLFHLLEGFYNSLTKEHYNYMSGRYPFKLLARLQ
jgi:hypothetical protein